MFNIGGGELIVIMLIALIVLGPKRLPDAARQIGKAMGDLRRLSTSFQNEVKTALDTADDPNQVASRRNLLANDEAQPAVEAGVDRSPRKTPLVAAPVPAQAPAKKAAKRASAKPATKATKAAPAKKATAKNGTAVKKRTPAKATPRRSKSS